MYKLIQGDVVLKQISKLPKNTVQMTSKLKSGVGGGKILQQSETTGHHHHFRGTALVDLYTTSRDTDVLSTLDFTTITPNEGKYIVVRDTNALLFHGKDFDFNPHAKGTGDHNALSVPPGIYEVDIVREYDYDKMEVTRVVD